MPSCCSLTVQRCRASPRSRGRKAVPPLHFCSHSCHKATVLSGVMQKETRPPGPVLRLARSTAVPFSAVPQVRSWAAEAPLNPVQSSFSLQLKSALHKATPRADAAPQLPCAQGMCTAPGSSKPVAWRQVSVWAEQREVLGPVRALLAGVPLPCWAQEGLCWDKQLAGALGVPPLRSLAWAGHLPLWATPHLEIPCVCVCRCVTRIREACLHERAPSWEGLLGHRYSAVQGQLLRALSSELRASCRSWSAPRTPLLKLSWFRVPGPVVLLSLTPPNSL